MKSILKVLALALSLTLFAIVIPKQASAQYARVSFQMFYDQLSPYGQWVDNQNYGYVWIPDVGYDFVPYRTDGQWVSTEYGWTWASNYDWGWAPFHYGRWDFDNNYGWFWVPGTDWGPAWVTWRRANGYYGWEPMGPGTSISLSFSRSYSGNNNHWNYVKYSDFDRPNIDRYAVRATDNNEMFKNSEVIRNTYTDRSRNATYISGPSRSDVQRYSGRNITPVTLYDNNKPGQNYSKGQLGIYRPQVQRDNVSGQRAAPSRIENLNNVKRPSERSGRAQPYGRPQPNARSDQQQNVLQQEQQQNTREQQQNARSDQQRKLQQQQNSRSDQQRQQEQQQNVRQQQQNVKSDQQQLQQQQQNTREQQQNARSYQQRQQQQQQNTIQEQQNARSNQQQQQQQQQNARQEQQNARGIQQQQKPEERSQKQNAEPVQQQQTEVKSQQKQNEEPIPPQNTGQEEKKNK